MVKIDPRETTVPEVHKILLGAVAPRPIAFASTINDLGIPNLSPFSFFNAFGVNPTTLIFSPSRRGRDNTTKHTYENLKKVPEVVINTVSYGLVEQSNLASTEFPEGVNEFVKAGLTPVESERIKPFRVKESPVQFECKVREVIETGGEGGAGNLVICEILLIHLNEEILDKQGNIDPHKIDLVGRLGSDFYCRTSGDAIFRVAKPLEKLGIGIDSLPERIKFSSYLTGNDLGKLGNIEKLPDEEEIREFKNDKMFNAILNESDSVENNEKAIHHFAKMLLSKGNTRDAIKALMSY